jgi:hypothetical protein
MADIKKSISLPETRAEMVQSHEFTTFIYPQIFAVSDTLSPKIYEQQTNLFGQAMKFDNLIGGIMNVNKNFEKEIIQRNSLGGGSFESYQSVPTKLVYDFTFDKVVFYKNINNNDLTAMIELESSGFIKNFIPFLMQETIKNPDGTVKEIATYYDVWITKDTCKIDLNNDDMLVVKNLSAKGNRVITQNNNNVGYAQIFNTATSALQDISNSGSKILINDFKIPLGGS